MSAGSHQRMHNLFWRQHLKVLGFGAQSRLVGQKLHHTACHESWFSVREVKLSHVENSPPAHRNSRRGRRQDLNPEQGNAATKNSMNPKCMPSRLQVKWLLNPSLGSVQLRLGERQRHFLVNAWELLQNCLEVRLYQSIVASIRWVWSRSCSRG